MTHRNSFDAHSIEGYWKKKVRKAVQKHLEEKIQGHIMNVIESVNLLIFIKKMGE